MDNSTNQKNPTNAAGQPTQPTTPNNQNEVIPKPSPLPAPPKNPLENLPKATTPPPTPTEPIPVTAIPKNPLETIVKPATPTTPKNPLENLPKPPEPIKVPPSNPSSPLPTMVLPPAPEQPAVPSSSPPAEMKKSPFRFLIPILGVVIVALLVAFVASKFIKPKSSNQTSNGGAANSAVVTVTYWGLWEPPIIMENIIHQFEAANPGIKINYEQQSIKDYRERLQNALASGNGPDMFRFHFTWTSLLGNALTPVPQNVLTETDFENQQYPVAKKWLQSGNNYMGIPLMYEGLGLYYNKQVFEAAGKTPPKTWEELRRTAIELTVKNKEGLIQRSGVALGTTSNVDNWSDILGVMMLQNGADPANPTTQLAQDALTFYTIFNTTDKVWDDSMPTSTVAFATEKAAMMIGPSWRAHDIRAMNPNLQFGIADLPQLPDTQVGWASIWADGVSAKSSKTAQEAAWKFLNYLNQKETLREWYAQASKQRLFGEIFARKDMAEQLSTDPYVAAYLDEAPYSKTWYLNSQTFDNGPNDKIINYYKDAVNAVLKGETAQKALNTAADGVSQIIKQYRLK